MDIFLSILHSIGVYFNAAILYLFDDNGVRIIRGYLILIIVDTILGTVRSAKKSRLKSRTYLYGIFLKLLGILSIVVANVIDDVLNNYMHINTGVDISDVTAAGMVAYEALSILENMREMHIFTGNVAAFISKYFDDDTKK